MKLLEFDYRQTPAIIPEADIKQLFTLLVIAFSTIHKISTYTYFLYNIYLKISLISLHVHRTFKIDIPIHVYI